MFSGEHSTNPRSRRGGTCGLSEDKGSTQSALISSLISGQTLLLDGRCPAANTTPSPTKFPLGSRALQIGGDLLPCFLKDTASPPHNLFPPPRPLIGPHSGRDKAPEGRAPPFLSRSPSPPGSHSGPKTASLVSGAAPPVARQAELGLGCQRWRLVCLSRRELFPRVQDPRPVSPPAAGSLGAHGGPSSRSAHRAREQTRFSLP